MSFGKFLNRDLSLDRALFTRVCIVAENVTLTVASAAAAASSLTSEYSVRVARTCALKCAGGSLFSTFRENLFDLKFCRPVSPPRRVEG